MVCYGISEVVNCDTVYYPLQEFQLKRLQHFQLQAASFVLSRYVNDILMILLR